MSAPYSKLTWTNMLFPLALVLFEFSVYICNDMVQPAMLAVIDEFNVDSSWVPTSMTAFIFGGIILGWLTGPLSDRMGRRPVLLCGVTYFIITCLAIYFVRSIEAFIALRVLQGIGLCFINAVGYATIQENFQEKAAVKATAFMANVALISPLIGPLAGAYFITFLPWRFDFLIIAMISFISLIGLICFMPETVNKHKRASVPIYKIAHDYYELITSKVSLFSAMSIPVLGLPLLCWIAMSPVLLVKDLGLTEFDYGILQVPVFIGSILGNIFLSYVADRWSLKRPAYLSLIPCGIGSIIYLIEGISSHPEFWMTAGMTLITFGEGMAFGVLYRFALTSNNRIGKGTIAAAMSIISMAGYSIGIEITKLTHESFGSRSFGWLMLIFFVLYIPLMLFAVRSAMKRTSLNEKKKNELLAH